MASETDPRLDPRSNVFLTAILYCQAISYPVRVRNLSVHGALLEAASLPTAGKQVRLKRGSLSASGGIAWQEGRHCGIRFDASIDVADWIKRTGHEGQHRVDAAIAEFRKSAPGPTSTSLMSEVKRTVSLDNVSDDLLRACERIAGLPIMSLELAEELLKIEAAAISIKTASRPLK